MNAIFIAIAVISLITGLFLLFSPNSLIKAGEWFNRLYNLDSYIYAKRHAFGVIFIVLGVLLLLFV